MKKNKNLIFNTVTFRTKTLHKDQEELAREKQEKQAKGKQDYDVLKLFEEEDNSNDYEIAKLLNSAGSNSPPRTRRFTRSQDKTVPKQSSIFKGIDNIINSKTYYYYISD